MIKPLNSEKEKMFGYLKHKPKPQNTSETNEPSDQKETPTNGHQKPLYCSVLKRKSNTNLRRKFSKQNLAYKDNNIKQTILNDRHNRSTSRNKSFEISQQATSERIKKRLFKTKSLL